MDAMTAQLVSQEAPVLTLTHNTHIVNGERMCFELAFMLRSF